MRAIFEPLVGYANSMCFKSVARIPERMASAKRLMTSSASLPRRWTRHDGYGSTCWKPNGMCTSAGSLRRVNWNYGNPSTVTIRCSRERLRRGWWIPRWKRRVVQESNTGCEH